MADRRNPWHISRRRLLQAGGATSAAALLSAHGSLAAYADPAPPDEDGHDLWMRYRPVTQPSLLDSYRRRLSRFVVQTSGAVIESAVSELTTGLSGLLGRQVPASGGPGAGAVVLGTAEESPTVRSVFGPGALERLGTEGYAIRTTGDAGLVIGSVGAKGLLYGTFHLLRLLQTQQDISALDLTEYPRNPLRLLNHWDNINDTVERGYAGSSIFEWSKPGLSPLVHDYARSLASIGLDRTVVNNVNANPAFLTSDMLDQVALVADALRPWGVCLMLSANFASPIVLGKLKTADPLDPDVKAWWSDKADEIYAKIPDFGGFLVKANSEGQPGPTDYGRTHADGANLIAGAVKPHGGICIWRAFVYDASAGDVATYAYHVFQPLDGQFADNAVVQAKYGPVDFHIREPVHPLFGAMPHTNMTLELQITQEHTGHETDLCTFAPWWKHVLDFDTYANGKGTAVATVIDGSAFGQPTGGMSGVSNFGADRNWTGNQLAQANSYTFGRLAWNPGLSPDDVLDEWTRMTFGPATAVNPRIDRMLEESWQTFEDYTSPLGIGDLVAASGAHYDPDPADANIADHHTIGNDRTVATGSGFTGLYHEPWSSIYESLTRCPDALLLFMHRVPYTHPLHSGTTVIQDIYNTHFDGLDAVAHYADVWRSLRRWIDPERYADIVARFTQNYAHAKLWRDTIVGYFFKLSRILDTERAWVQYAMATPEANLVLGGWPNTVGVEIGNGSADTLSVAAHLKVPEDWTAGTVTTDIASTDFAKVDLPVIPPPIGTIVPADVSIDTGTLPLLGVGGASLVVAPAGPRCSLALDGGSTASPLLAGYRRLSPQDAWHPDRGYGWVGGAPQQRDRGASLDPLRRDFCADTSTRTLRVAVPSGKHPTFLLVGDVVTSQPTIVTVDGAEAGRSEKLDGSRFTWIPFTLDGGASGRTVDVALSSIPGEYWHLNALAVVDPKATLPDVVITDLSTNRLITIVDHPAQVTFQATNTTSASMNITPTASISDGYTVTVTPTGASVPAGGSTRYTASVTRSAGTGAGTLTIGVGDQHLDVALAATNDLVRVATMTASSTLPGSSPSTTNDGSTDSSLWGNGSGGWNDGTRGAFPDWLAAGWDATVDISRVRMYTLDSTRYPASAWGLRDYDIQLRIGDAWQTVTQVRSNTSGMVESSFDTISTTGLRLLVLDTNDHGYSRVMELEAYRT